MCGWNVSERGRNVLLLIHCELKEDGVTSNEKDNRLLLKKELRTILHQPDSLV